MCQPPQGSPLGREFLRRQTTIAPVLELFHYHLVTSSVREVEARYLGKLGFRLVARYGRIGEDQVHYEAGVSWEQLEQAGFRHRLSELDAREGQVDVGETTVRFIPEGPRGRPELYGELFA